MDETFIPYGQSPEQRKLLLTIEEAAIVMSLGRTLVYELVRRNEITSIKVGRSRRIPVSALRKYISARLALVQKGA
jgi:excisionase family DNA binding protein